MPENDRPDAPRDPQPPAAPAGVTTGATASAGNTFVAAPGGNPDPPDSPWRTLAAREAYRNPWLSVTEYAVRRPDGLPGIYGVVDPGDNATMLALDADDYVYLVGDFVYPIQRYQWSAPSGKVEAGEEPLHAAQRELREEAGISAALWTPLGAYYLSPGIATQISYLYLARDIHLGQPQREGTEQMTLRHLPLREAVEMCLTGEVRDAPSTLALLRAWLLLHPLPSA